MKILKFDFPGIGNTEITIVSDELAEFAKRQLFLYLVAEAEGYEKSDKNTIIASGANLLNKAKSFFTENKKLARIYCVQDNRLRFANLEYRLENNQLVIKSNADKKQKWYKRHKKLDYAQCHIRFYNQILFPLFSLYTLLDGYYLVHGTALSYKKKNMIIVGLDGVGKSSLANLLSEKSAVLYADNFVLFNGKNVMPLNLAMRLDPNQHTQLRVLYRDSNLQEAIPDKIQTKPVVVDKIVLLYIGDKFALSGGNNDLTGLVLFTNNAPEINAANTTITPFLYNTMSGKHTKNNIPVSILSCPLGQLDKAVEVL
ncbi:MAG: hypothetical protein MJ165_04615 [Alphaproteobacteria bacterium]|nr:hypothetical protein [Alphaproteobacteria bacterium]